MRPAHTLKGTSLNVGAVQLAEACRALEELARRGDLDASAAYLYEADTAFARVLEALSGARLLRWQSE